jgi:hypothetical protein
MMPSWWDYEADLFGSRPAAPKAVWPGRTLLGDDLPAFYAVNPKFVHPWGTARDDWATPPAPESPSGLRVLVAPIEGLFRGVTVVSHATIALAITALVGASEALSIVGLVLDVFEAGGWLGRVGRIATTGAMAVPLGRMGWLAARWGVAPIGVDR